MEKDTEKKMEDLVQAAEAGSLPRFVRPAPDAAGFWACKYHGKTNVCDVYPVLRTGWLNEMLFVRFASPRQTDCLVVELPDGGEWQPIDVTWPNDQEMATLGADAANTQTNL